MSVGELRDVNYAEILPFHSINDYKVENEFLSTRGKFVNLMDNEKFENLLKDNKYEHFLNPGIMLPCQYFDEDEFIETKMKR